MIQLFEFSTLEGLNEFLEGVDKKPYAIKKVKLLTVGDRIKYFVLIEKGVPKYQVEAIKDDV